MQVDNKKIILDWINSKNPIITNILKSDSNSLMIEIYGNSSVVVQFYDEFVEIFTNYQFNFEKDEYKKIIVQCARHGYAFSDFENTGLQIWRNLWYGNITKQIFFDCISSIALFMISLIAENERDNKKIIKNLWLPRD